MKFPRTFNISVKTYRRLKELAYRLGKSMSQIIDEAVNKYYLEVTENEEKGKH